MEHDLPRGAAPIDPSLGGDIVEQILGLKLPFVRARDRVLDEFRRRYVEGALAEQGGNVARAAQASGIDRRYFQRIRAKLTDP